MSIGRHVANLDTLILFLFPHKESVALQREAVEDLHTDSPGDRKTSLLCGDQARSKTEPRRCKEIRQSECDTRAGSTGFYIYAHG